MDEQMMDRKQTEYELDEIFYKLLIGVTLNVEEINLLRWAVGFPEIRNASQIKKLFDEHRTH